MNLGNPCLGFPAKVLGQRSCCTWHWMIDDVILQSSCVLLVCDTKTKQNSDGFLDNLGKSFRKKFAKRLRTCIYAFSVYDPFVNFTASQIALQHELYSQ